MRYISHLQGPFRLTSNGIEEQVVLESPGVYALGVIINAAFQVNYVGRSDDDVSARLHKHIGEDSHFQFEYCDSPKAAFKDECLLYHAYMPPRNKIHPSNPKGKNYKCPIVECEYNEEN